MRGNALQRLSSFVHGQGHMVVLGEEVLQWHPLEYRVQQDILSPLLFYMCPLAKIAWVYVQVVNNILMTPSSTS